MDNKQILNESFFKNLMMFIGGAALWKMLRRPTKLKHFMKDPEFRKLYKDMKVSIKKSRELANQYRAEVGLPPLPSIKD